MKIGVVGIGAIGTQHIQRFIGLPGVQISAVFDVDQARVTEMAAYAGGTAYDDAFALIKGDDTDAILIASPGHLHADQVVACLDAGKPVFCEKPLGTSTADCIKVVEAEVRVGRRLVQLGFMRRFDPGLQAARERLAGGEVGEALLLHCIHRNATLPPTFKEFMAITDSSVHEIDQSRWMLGEEIVRVNVRSGKRSPGSPAQDPMLVELESESGVLINVESFVNCKYGYDVRCELVGSEGVINADYRPSVTNTGALSRVSRVPEEWNERFEVAFLRQAISWLNAITTGEYQGASAWDGYVATVVAEAGLASLHDDGWIDVTLIERPAFYDRWATQRPDGPLSSTRISTTGLATISKLSPRTRPS